MSQHLQNQAPAQMQQQLASGNINVQTGQGTQMVAMKNIQQNMGQVPPPQPQQQISVAATNFYQVTQS